MINTTNVCVLRYVPETKTPKKAIIASFEDWALFCYFCMYIYTCFMYTLQCFVFINLNFMYVTFNFMYPFEMLSTFLGNVHFHFLSVLSGGFDVRLQTSAVQFPITHVQKHSRGCTL